MLVVHMGAGFHRQEKHEKCKSSLRDILRTSGDAFEAVEKMECGNGFAAGFGKHSLDECDASGYVQNGGSCLFSSVAVLPPNEDNFSPIQVVKKLSTVGHPDRCLAGRSVYKTN